MLRHHFLEVVIVTVNKSISNKGPAVLYSEFEKALEELKNKKAPGPGSIPAELLKALGSAGKRELFEICNEIYIRGEWPEISWSL